MSDSYDCIVWGLGGFGSSALMHLASQGIKVLGIDQFSPPHNRGSSHGHSRVIRKAYFEHPDYVPLLHRAYELWRDLESATGRTLLRQTGLVLSGPSEAECIAGTKSAAQQHGLSLDVLNAQEAGERWPHLMFSEGHEAVYEHEAGTLFVEDCVEAHLFLAMTHGARTRFGEPVRSISFRGDAVQLRTDSDTYSAGSLVVCCGAWTPQLFGNALPQLRVLRKIQQWQQLDPAFSSAWTESPAYYFEQPQGAFYGFPSFNNSTVKLSEHSGGEHIASPEQLQREVSESDLLSLRDFAARTLRGVSSQVAKSCVCMYTMSPDGHFILDRHPQHHNVILAAGFSGHGFKFTSVLGEALADLTINGSTRLPVGFLGLERFRDSCAESVTSR